MLKLLYTLFLQVRKRIYLPAGVAEQTVPIMIIDDDEEEDDESFTVRLFDLKCELGLFSEAQEH